MIFFEIILDSNKENENISSILEELDLEIKQNNDKYEKLKHSPIIFGQSLQFEHINSNKFLTFYPGQSNYGLSDNFE